MIKRRESSKLMGAVSADSKVPQASRSAASNEKDSKFRLCFNPSTIMGQGLGLIRPIEIAAEVGYDGIEIWIRDIDKYLKEGNSFSTLKNVIRSSGLSVECAIGYANWIVEDDEQRRQGFIQMEKEMNMVAELECRRIASPPAGFDQRSDLDYLKAGERYRQLVELGRKTGVMPQLEVWGPSKSLFNMGQALLIAAVADDPDVRILADVFHLYKGGSGFNSLKMLNGNIIEIFHINDYPGNIPREEQRDEDRVYPGDGVAPMTEILTDLQKMGGTKVLSLELFNEDYWKQDPVEVATTGLKKMKEQVNKVL